MSATDDHGWKTSNLQAVSWIGQFGLLVGIDEWLSDISRGIFEALGVSILVSRFVQ